MSRGEKARKRWSDPVWAAAQRKKISDGMKASPHAGAGGEARTKRQRPLSRYSIESDDAAERGRRGAEKRWFFEERTERPVYHPLHDNPRMQRLLGGSR